MERYPRKMDVRSKEYNIHNAWKMEVRAGIKKWGRRFSDLNTRNKLVALSVNLTYNGQDHP